MTRRLSRARRGSIVVLAAFLMIGMMAFLAFAIDLGVLCVARDELQRSADASAIAAAWELIDEDSPPGFADVSVLESNARSRANEYAGLNSVLMADPSLAEQDVQVGYLADPTDADSPFQTTGFNTPNAVRVVVRRTSDQNGTVPFFFGRVLGMNETAVQAEATAALLSNLGGLRAPSDGSNLDLLPFALDYDTWNAWVNNNVGRDDWTWDAECEQVVAGPDGVLEVNLYPQGTGSPGNRGTVDIGGSNNSTNDIARQITDGVSSQDLEHHGGALEFDDNGELFLNGDTGISAGVKDELASIIGEPRCIPVFTEVCGPGNNAEYTITMLMGVRIMEVKLTGKNTAKKVMIQPATLVTKGGIPGGNNSSFYVYSPVRLVR